jgi:hypothetical protein
MTHDQFEDILTKVGGSDRLSATERSAIRTTLLNYLKENPAARAPIRSTVYAWTLWFDRPAFAVTAFILAIGVTSGGVAAAAEGTLPGDALYPIKVQFTEPLRTALTISPKAKIALQRSYAVRRLEEAAVLADEDRLNADTEAAITANFEYNADIAQDELSDEIAQTDFTARLKAHENVLARVDEQNGKKSTSALQKAIRVHVERASPEALTLSAKATDNSRAMPASNVTSLRDAALDALEDSGRLLKSVENEFSASSSVAAHALYEKAQKSVAEGNERLEEDDTNSAAQAFKNALGASRELEVSVRAASRLHIDAFSELRADISDDDTDSESDERDSTEVDDEDVRAVKQLLNI